LISQDTPAKEKMVIGICKKPKVENVLYGDTTYGNRRETDYREEILSDMS
jgi:hypothetical protein